MANGFQNNAIFWVEVDKIKPNPYQPRKEFDEAALQSLADSIKQYGVLQPLVVTRKEEHTEDGGLKVYYELVAGERRLRASKLAGLNQVPVLIRDKEDTDQEKLELAIIENLQREDLNPIDKALAFKQLHEKFKMTHAQIAQKVGKSREYVSNALRLLSLPEDIQRAIANGIISEGHARPLLMLADKPEEQQTLFKEITMQKLTVREAEHIARSVATDKVRKNHIPPKLRKIEKELTENLGTRVRIEQKDGQVGRVHIDFTSEDDLYHLLELVKNHEKHALTKSPKLLEDKEGNADNPELPETLAGAAGLASALGAENIVQNNDIETANDDNSGKQNSDETNNSETDQTQDINKSLGAETPTHENTDALDEKQDTNQSVIGSNQNLTQNNETTIDLQIDDFADLTQNPTENTYETTDTHNDTNANINITNFETNLNSDGASTYNLEQTQTVQNTQAYNNETYIDSTYSGQEVPGSEAGTEQSQVNMIDENHGSDLRENENPNIETDENQAMDISQFSSIEENSQMNDLKNQAQAAQNLEKAISQNESENQVGAELQGSTDSNDSLSAFEQKIDQMIKESKEKALAEQEANQIQYPSGTNSDITLSPELENLEQKMQADISAIMQNPSVTPASASSVEATMQDQPQSSNEFSGDTQIAKQIEEIMKNDGSDPQSTAELGVTFNEYKEEQDTMPGFDGETLTPAQKATLASQVHEENASFNADAEDLDSLVRKTDPNNDSDLYSVKNF